MTDQFQLESWTAEALKEIFMQGLVNMVDVGPDTTGTLLVKDKSHEGHAPFFETACKLSRAEMVATTDHYQLKPHELPFFDAYESMGLHGKAGSVFLWDSRTIHAVRPFSSRSPESLEFPKGKGNTRSNASRLRQRLPMLSLSAAGHIIALFLLV